MSWLFSIVLIGLIIGIYLVKRAGDE